MNGIHIYASGSSLSRRMANGGYDYAHAKEVLYLNEIMSISAFLLFFFQLFSFIISFGQYLEKDMKQSRIQTHEKATTIEWTVTTSTSRVWKF